MVALGFALAVWAVGRRGAAAGFSTDLFWDLGFWCMVGGMAGARLLFVIRHWSYYAEHGLEIPALWRGGLESYGGYLGGALAGWWFVRRRRLSFWKLADLCAPAIPLGTALGRIGCFLNGCCWGRACSPGAFYGVRFPPESAHALATGGIGGWVVNTQMIESLGAFLLAGVLFLRSGRKRFEGELFLMLGMLYPIMRFGIEILRDDTPRYLWGWTLAQWVSVSLFAVAGWRYRRQ
jgi:phosphatidylglycerol:prolipoprotein diacylglycerol transferase